MRRPAYRDAIAWIALNDDCEWVKEIEPIPSVAAVLVADLFAAELERVVKDIRRHTILYGNQRRLA